jgi:hypothetical protein
LTNCSANIKEVSRWWAPGQRLDEEERYKQYPFAGDRSSWTGNHGACTVPIRIEDGGTVGYGGWGIFGMYVHDFSDITKPKTYGHVSNDIEGMGGIPFHTCYPRGRRCVEAGTAESGDRRLQIPRSRLSRAVHTSYVVDVKDRTRPKIIGQFPRPVAPSGAPYADFCQARGRFSAHNMQSWIAPGRMRPDIVALSYFNAGLRIYDISNPTQPKEVAYFLSPRDGKIEDFASWRRGTSENIFMSGIETSSGCRHTKVSTVCRHPHWASRFLSRPK